MIFVYQVFQGFKHFILPGLDLEPVYAVVYNPSPSSPSILSLILPGGKAILELEDSKVTRVVCFVNI